MLVETHMQIPSPSRGGNNQNFQTLYGFEIDGSDLIEKGKRNPEKVDGISEQDPADGSNGFQSANWVGNWAYVLFVGLWRFQKNRF